MSKKLLRATLAPRSPGKMDDVAEFNELTREERATYIVKHDPSGDFRPERAKFLSGEVREMCRIGVFTDGTIMYDRTKDKYVTVRPSSRPLRNGAKYQTQHLGQSSAEELTKAGVIDV